MVKIGDQARRWLAFAPAVLYYAGIFWLSSRSHPPSLPSFPLADKVAHVFLYTGFGAGLRFACGRFLRERPGAVFGAAFALGLLGGILDEIHQAFVPLRDSNVWDAAADALGVLAGIVIFAWIAVRWRASSRARD
ncbi:MAG: VanZ family protein [Candidatus Aminicenantes bacterium]|nr:VanZ family protein [Candidatus Aminicenantes bacterium]